MSFVSGNGRLGSKSPKTGICRTFIPLGVAKGQTWDSLVELKSHQCLIQMLLKASLVCSMFCVILKKRQQCALWRLGYLIIFLYRSQSNLLLFCVLFCFFFEGED